MRRANVNTLDLVNSLPYPFLIAKAPTKYPSAFKTQKNGMANTLIMKGPIRGTAATKATIPANACVNTPRRSVPNTTIFLSIPKRKETAIAIAITIAIKI